jgi:hypothetical protein
VTMPLRAEAALDRRPLDHELPPAGPTTEVTRRYGRDDSTGDALAGVLIDVSVGQCHGHDGPRPVPGVHADARPR